MALLPVDEAKAMILAGVRPLPAETVPLAEADRRVLARDLKARRDQPPFAASAMDGYAVRAADGPAGARLNVIGAAHAGNAFKGHVGASEAVRIFTGAPLPKGADAIVIQENVERRGEVAVLTIAAQAGQHIRALGLDFNRGETLIARGTRLGPHALGLAAAMGYPAVPVSRRPCVAIIATGDELVAPGTGPRADQIYSSNSFALAALAARAGADARDLGIAGDTPRATERAIAKALDVDILVTTGGASVGERDLVQDSLRKSGVRIAFWKIALRPGKPLMFGKRGRQRVIGLPGNPVSALVCARLFLVPLLEAMQGLAPWEQLVPARLGAPLRENDERQDYLRARLARRADGWLIATPFQKQDSSMMRTLCDSGALIVRRPHAPAMEMDEVVDVLPLHDQ